MRARTIVESVGILALLAVGAATLSRAQVEAKSPAADKVKLRSQVAALRAEVELLELEHEVEVDRLKKLMTDVRNLEDMEAADEFMKQKLPDLRAKLGKNDHGEALKEIVKQSMPNLQVNLGESDQVEADIGKPFDLDSMTRELARPYLDRLKKQFLRRTAELAEKRLELAEAERSYGVSR
jgi:hypothetical protein